LIFRLSFSIEDLEIPELDEIAELDRSRGDAPTRI